MATEWRATEKIAALLSRGQLFHSEIHGDLGLGDVGNRDHMPTSSAAVKKVPKNALFI